MTSQGEESELEVEKRLATFAKHRKSLISILREQYERGPRTKPFDEKDAWQGLKFIAWTYLQHEADVDETRLTMPAADRVKLLRQLGKALRAARQKADEVMPIVRGHLFVEWCVANGNPDFTDAIIERYKDRFLGVVAGVSALEQAAFQAAESIQTKRGPLSGTTALPHRFILTLESFYRNRIKQKAGAGPGPFVRFVKKVTTALGRELSEQSVIKAVQEAKKREEGYGPLGQWGRSLLLDELGGKLASSSR
jgi:hypothetical protein